jgi:hypothetical protein
MLYGPNIAVEWLAFLPRIREVEPRPGDNYPDWRYCGFLSPSRKMPEKNLKLGHDRFLPHPLQFGIY